MADCPPSSVTATVTLQFTGNGMLDGEFTVSTDKKVNFSKGNLQYQASTNTWRFAENQWDYIGNAAGNTTAEASRATQTDWIDLFGWATSGSQASNVIGYQPYYISNINANYGPAIASGEWTKENSDWGTVNADQLGLGWHVLSNAEWAYLLNSRTNAANLKTFAIVHNLRGVILLPDTWTQANSHMSGTLTITTSASTASTVSDANWTILENEGAVFLPAAGNRSTSYSPPRINNVNENSWYWTSTAYNKDRAYALQAGGSSLYTTYLDRSTGVSVRLVKSLH